MSAFTPILDRARRAHADFAEILMQRGGIDQPTAERLTGFYIKRKLAKVELGIGRITVKHGALLDREVIRRAAEALS